MTTSVGPQRPAVEVADVIREYGEKFLARYGGTLTGGNAGRCDLAACRTAALGGHLQALRRLRSRSRRPTTPVAIAIAPSARPRPEARARPRGRGSCSRSSITTPSSRCRRRWPRSPSPDRHCCTTCCSGRPRRPCGTWPPIRSAWATQLGVLMVLHTWGRQLQHHPHVHCVVTGAACRATLRESSRQRPVGCRAGPAFSCRCASSVACSGGSTWPCCGRLLRKVGSAAGPMRPLSRAG